MKNELYYSANTSSKPESSSSFSFITNKFFLFLLFLSILGGFFYFNPESLQKLIESTKSKTKKILIYEETQKEPKKEESPSLKKAEKLSQEELQNIANEIVKSLKSIETEKKSLEKKLIETTARCENMESSIKNIHRNEEVTLEKLNSQPIATPSFKPKPKPHKRKETPSVKKESYPKKVPYQEEIITEREEEVFDDSYIEFESDPALSKDLLETLSVELNNAVIETSIEESYPEESLEPTAIEETYIEQESMEMSLY